MFEACRHRLVVPHQRGAGAGRYPPYPGPEIRADLEILTIAIVQRAHPLLAHRFALLQKLLGRVDEGRVHGVEEALGLGPGFTFGLAGDHVETHAEADRPTLCLRLGFHSVHTLSGHGWWFSPQQVDVDIAGGDLLGDGGRAAEEYTRTGSGGASEVAPRIL